MNNTFEAQYNALVKQNRELQKQNAEYKKIIESVKDFCEESINLNNTYGLKPDIGLNCILKIIEEAKS